MAMTTQLVTIVNKVNNAAIRRVKNERGDLVYIVPSYTLPDNVVMNGGLYPAEEIEKSYATLEGTPAPAGHPMDANGNYITANSPDGILYYQCGIFNKNVKRVNCEQYGNRVYVEKHIHVETAMQTERGRRIIDAIDKGLPIHTSTGVIVERVDEQGISTNGKDYSWRAESMLFDHDAILLDEDGAATPNDGVGMMVNANLLTHITKDGTQLTVNSSTLDVNQSFNDLRESLQTKIQKKFGDDERHVWLHDFGDDYLVFEDNETSYMVKYMRDDEGNVIVDDALEEVKRKTIWERISSGVKSVLTSPFVGLTSNQDEGKDMYKEHIMKQLKANSIDTANMDDAAILEAHESMLQANAAETTAQGEQSQPDVQTMVNEAVKAAMKDMKDDEDMGEKKKMAEKLKSNSVELSELEIKALSVNSLQAMLDKASAPAPAFGLAGSASLQNNSDDSDLYDTLPE